MKFSFRNYAFPLILLSSIIIGSVIGYNNEGVGIALKPIGDFFLNLLFVVVVPLVFFSVASSFANGGGEKFGKIMRNMSGVFLFTGIIAAIIMLVVMKVYPPAHGVHIPIVKPDATDKVSVAEQIVNTFTVNDFSGLFSRSNMLAIIVFAVLVGLATNKAGDKADIVKKLLSSANVVIMNMVNYIMYLAPVGLGAYFAYLVPTYGKELLGSYERVFVLYYVTAILFYFIVYSIIAYMAGGSYGFKIYWKNVLPSTLTSLGTCSSAATIPTNFESAEKMGVSKNIRETVIPLASALHKDGSVMGGVVKIAFAFGVFGMNFSGLNIYLVTIGIALLVGMVMGAIPNGGMIGEMLILSLFGLPVESLPILAAISTIIDPPATMLNATGDLSVSMLVERLTNGKKAA
ncbi:MULTISPECIES: dicarboxylate/amino acid:cation symporter [Bacillaceae]|uniref:Sodium:proton antiporter n=1 Tax=Gottfriedia luciferensis TaxID=178774 RepID=A0ABX2ZM38_9BACI|nr:MULTISPECIES: dicarboxylate/amino acid:cation symporter [Bacillaceae]ODG90785.1 sodium:proton antiporter [Gottfriedia luciferensis]PGZ90543.1 dicarboxylate/amino acid:cation symporter [Bacillus sp. AFS029533]